MRIRFHAARDVFSAFPTMSEDMTAGPEDHAPLGYLDALMTSETPEDAVTFFAYLAPKREAVWWACRCIRRLEVPLSSPPALELAERWVGDPEDEHRRHALLTAETCDSGAPETWAAYAAGWAGGNIAPEGLPAIAAAPHLTAKAVRASVLIAISLGPAKERRVRIKACHGEAVAVAGDDFDRQVG